jgi:hypothetical protein
MVIIRRRPGRGLGLTTPDNEVPVNVGLNGVFDDKGAGRVVVEGRFTGIQPLQDLQDAA